MKIFYNVCLEANHRAINCQVLRPCTVEGYDWRHHTLLHRKRVEKRDSNSNAHINIQLCTEESVKRVQEEEIFAIVPVSVKKWRKVGGDLRFPK